MTQEYVSSTQRIIILGDSAVGKTSFISTVLSLFSSAQNHKNEAVMKLEVPPLPTVGIQFYKFTVPLHEGEGNGASGLLKVQLWDTSGSPASAAVVSSLYTAADAVVIVFNTFDRKSFQNALSKWNKEFQLATHYSNFPHTNDEHRPRPCVMLLGNAIAVGKLVDIGGGKLSARNEHMSDEVTSEEQRSRAVNCGIQLSARICATSGEGVRSATEMLLAALKHRLEEIQQRDEMLRRAERSVAFLPRLSCLGDSSDSQAVCVQSPLRLHQETMLKSSCSSVRTKTTASNSSNIETEDMAGETMWSEGSMFLDDERNPFAPSIGKESPKYEDGNLTWACASQGQCKIM